MTTENKNAGGVWRPQPRQMEFMRRPEPEALYGGAAGGVAEKVQAAAKTGAQLVVLRRPPEAGETEDELFTHCQEMLQWSH